MIAQQFKNLVSAGVWINEDASDSPVKRFLLCPRSLVDSGDEWQVGGRTAFPCDVCSRTGDVVAEVNDVRLKLGLLLRGQAVVVGGVLDISPQDCLNLTRLERLTGTRHVGFANATD